MFKLQFTTENAAFEGGEAPTECARILAEIARKVGHGATLGPVHDLNGNRVGAWSLELPDEDEDEEGKEGASDGLNSCPDCGAHYEGEDYFCPACTGDYVANGKALHDVKRGDINN